MISDLLKDRAAVLAQMAAIQEVLNELDEQINEAISPRLVEIRDLQQKPYGTVNITLEGYKITETVPKKVEWDQPTMMDIFERIMKAGDTPANYMKLKLEVPEKNWEAFDASVRAVFEPARTVKTGKPQLKFEVVADA